MRCDTYEHLAGVERELDAADGRGQEGLHVGVLAAGADGLALDLLHGDDAQVDPQLDVLPVLVSRQDEGVILAELKRRGVRWHLLLQESVVVLLAEDDLLLGQSNVLEDLVKVERPLAEVVVRLEEIEVPRLHHEEKGVLARRLDIE